MPGGGAELGDVGKWGESGRLGERERNGISGGIEVRSMGWFQAMFIPA